MNRLGNHTSALALGLVLWQRTLANVKDRFFNSRTRRICRIFPLFRIRSRPDKSLTLIYILGETKASIIFFTQSFIKTKKKKDKSFLAPTLSDFGARKSWSGRSYTQLPSIRAQIANWFCVPKCKRGRVTWARHDKTLLCIKHWGEGISSNL